MPGPGFYFYGDEERKEVEDVLSIGYLSRYGSEDDPQFKHKVFTFESEFSQKMGALYCVAVNSGTSALMEAGRITSLLKSKTSRKGRPQSPFSRKVWMGL